MSATLSARLIQAAALPLPPGWRWPRKATDCAGSATCQRPASRCQTNPEVGHSPEPLVARADVEVAQFEQIRVDQHVARSLAAVDDHQHARICLAEVAQRALGEHLTGRADHMANEHHTRLDYVERAHKGVVQERVGALRVRSQAGRQLDHYERGAPGVVDCSDAARVLEVGAQQCRTAAGIAAFDLREQPRERTRCVREQRYVAVLVIARGDVVTWRERARDRLARALDDVRPRLRLTERRRLDQVACDACEKRGVEERAS